MTGVQTCALPILADLPTGERRPRLAIIGEPTSMTVANAHKGAAILTTLPQVLTVFQEYEQLMLGLVMMLVMIFMREGLLPSITRRIRGRAE